MRLKLNIGFFSFCAVVKFYTQIYHGAVVVETLVLKTC